MRTALLDQALIAEALRVNDRYLREVVVAHDFCPWAAKSLRDGRVLRRVLTGAEPALDSALDFSDALEASTFDIGLLLFPRVTLPANEFDRFAESVRQGDRRRRAKGKMPEFVVQAFHPFPDTPRETPHQLVAFIRRSPDPTLQFVRYTTLEEARRNAPEISDNIAERNFAAAREAGLTRLEALLDELRRDRDQAYARIGIP